MELEEIINQYTNYIYTIVKNMSYGNLNKEDIEEIVSDVFFIFWKKQNRFDKSKKIEPYLAGIAKNLTRSKFRKVSIISNIEDYEDYTINSSDVSLSYEQIEKQSIIENELNSMAKEDKDIFILFYYYSKKIKEISNQLGFSEFKVKSKLFRIRKKLKSKLEEGGYRYE